MLVDVKFKFYFENYKTKHGTLAGARSSIQQLMRSQHNYTETDEFVIVVHKNQCYHNNYQLLNIECWWY